MPEVTTPTSKTEDTPKTETTAASVAKEKKTAAKKAPAKKPTSKAVAKKEKSVKTSSGTHDGTAVGWKAKTLVDCKWNKTRVEYYKAFRKAGGEGTAADIAKASGGKIAVGLCLHYGYHGVAAGLNKLEDREDVRGFYFVLTAKGRNLDLDKMLEKEKAKKAKDKE